MVYNFVVILVVQFVPVFKEELPARESFGVTVRQVLFPMSVTQAPPPHGKTKKRRNYSPLLTREQPSR